MIGIIGAMDIEVDILISKLEGAVCETVSGIKFFVGKIGGHDTVIAKCGIGKVHAAMCAEAMIIKYSPDIVINTGIAGTLSPKLSILDVAVAKALVQHDFDIFFFGYPRGKIPGINMIEIPTDVATSRAIEGIIKQLGVGCEYGVIASGDQFICDEDKKEALARDFSAVACEMEGASIGQVCYLNKVPFTVIRAISDPADGSEMDYDTFSEKAAHLSASIVESFIRGI